MNKAKIEVISSADWKNYRSLRLQSLKESPDSFGSSYEREFQFQDDEWKARLHSTVADLPKLPLIAYVDNAPCGLASGTIHLPDLSTVNVYQMWVAAEYRGKGVGRALLDQILLWAEKLKKSSISLSVTTSNREAVALYESFGFVSQGRTEALRAASSLRAQPMILKLRE